MNIRLLSASDAEAYREIRLRALKNEPAAFGSTYEQEVDRPVEQFAERIQLTEYQFTLGCFDEKETLVGIVGFVQESRSKTAHKGNVYGMYVETEFRGRGLSKALMRTLINRATQTCAGLEQIHLAVVSNNAAATRLYKALGFEVYGVEPHALKLDGQYFDEDLMVLRVKR